MNIIKYLPLPKNYEYINSENGSNKDIINAILTNYEEAVRDCAQLAKVLKTGNVDQDCENIWKLLKSNLIYKRDLDEKQTIMLPRVAFRKKHTDCKTFAVCGAAIAGAMGYTVVFRFAGYNNAKAPSHVYFYVRSSKGKKIIDGCAPRYNWEKPYTLKIDKNMKVVTLNDHVIDRNQLQETIKKLPQSAKDNLKKVAELAVYDQLLKDQGYINDEPITINKKERTPEQIAKAKKRNEKAKEGLKKFGHANMYLALILGRGAFMACLLMNLNGMANKLQKLQKMGKLEPILDKWYKLGGIKKMFLKTIEKGAKHKPLFLSKKAKARYAKIMGTPVNDLCTDQECINAAPLAAVAAAAIPVIAALVPVMVKAFKGMGKGGAPEATELTAQAQDIVSNAYTQDEATKGSEIDYAEIPESIGSLEEYVTINANEQLWGELGKMAGSALEMLTNKIKKKNPKVGAVIDKGAQFADDYATGQYLRTSGYKDKMIKGKETLDTVKDNSILIIGGLGLAAVLLSRK